MHTTNAWSHASDRRVSRRQHEVHLVTTTCWGVSPIVMRYEGPRYVACAEPAHRPLRGHCRMGFLAWGSDFQARTAAACVEPSDALRPQRRSKGTYAEAIRMNNKVTVPRLPAAGASDGGLIDVLRHRDRDRREVCGAGKLPPLDRGIRTGQWRPGAKTPRPRSPPSGQGAHANNLRNMTRALPMPRRQHRTRHRGPGHHDSGLRGPFPPPRLGATQALRLVRPPRAPAWDCNPNRSPTPLFSALL